MERPPAAPQRPTPGELTSGEIEPLLRSSRTIAVIGASPRPERASHSVAAYLQRHGYRVIPVNPALPELLGERCYPDLASIPADVEVDIADVFRRAEFVPAIVEQAIERRCRAVWLQLGVVDEVSARRARDAGLVVVMDRCIKVDHGMLVGG